MKLEKNTKYIFWILGILLAWAFFKDSKTTVETFSMFGSSAVSITLVGIPILLLLLIPIYGIYISIKKHYNPFKMWGSWLGAFVGFIGTYLVLTIQYSNIRGEFGFLCANAGGRDFCSTFMDFVMQELLPLPMMGGMVNYIGLILGFLLGWGIHSLIRRYK